VAKKIILSQEQTQYIIKSYINGKSAMTIAKEIGYSDKFIQTTLKNNNIVLRTYSEANRQYKIDEHFFDIIDTEEKAYFLGFLWADGSIKQKSNAIVLKLDIKDKEILSRLSQLIYGFEHLYEYSYGNEQSCTLQFSSANIKQKLIDLGCVPNKTFILKYPTLNKSMEQHFIRGYFDGDGSIYRYNNDFTVSFIGTENLCIGLNNTISQYLGIQTKIQKNKEMLSRGNNITSILLYRGNRRVETLMDWLYKDATIFLKRKHTKYLTLKSLIAEIDKDIN